MTGGFNEEIYWNFEEHLKRSFNLKFSLGLHAGNFILMIKVWLVLTLQKLVSEEEVRNGHHKIVSPQKIQCRKVKENSAFNGKTVIFHRIIYKIKNTL